MTIETAFHNLSDNLRWLGEALDQLRLTTEDGPSSEETVLVDLLLEPVEDMLGLQKEAYQAALKAERAVNPVLDAQRAQRALSTCHRKVQELAFQYDHKLASYGQQASLAIFGRQQHGQHLGWVKSLRDGMERCQLLLEATDRSLLQCWQELTSRTSGSYVSVQATSIGQVSPERSD